MTSQRLLLLLTVFSLLTFVSSSAAKSIDVNHQTRLSTQENNPPRILLFIGDGMGEVHRQAARWAGYGMDGELYMDSLDVTGMSGTAPYGGVGITDSAAAATAMAAGVKTYRGYVGVDHNQAPVDTILEIAKQRGYSVGLVTTKSIGDATPASFAAHIPDRYQMTEIVDQMLTLGVDIMLGGGEDDFIPINEMGCFPDPGHRLDGRNLLIEAENAGLTVTCDPNALNQQLVLSNTEVLGLFGDTNMLNPFTPSLAKMTAFAIEALSDDLDGFFLMVEGGQIDTESHSNSADKVIENTLGFDDAVSVGLTYAQGRTDTLLIVTADHETGGMGLSLVDTGDLDQDGPFYMPDGTPFYVTWSTNQHTGVDVPTTAQGLCAAGLAGSYENTHIFEIMARALDNCPLSSFYLPIMIRVKAEIY